MAAPKFFDRVKETTATVGTAPFVLDGAAIGFRAFGDVLSNGDECYYACNPPGAAEWEVGIGMYNSGVLTRTSVLASSNNNALVVFPVGTKDIFLDLPAISIQECLSYLTLDGGRPDEVFGGQPTIDAGGP